MVLASSFRHHFRCLTRPLFLPLPLLHSVSFLSHMYLPPNKHICLLTCLCISSMSRLSSLAIYPSIIYQSISTCMSFYMHESFRPSSALEPSVSGAPPSSTTVSSVGCWECVATRVSGSHVRHFELVASLLKASAVRSAPAYSLQVQSTKASTAPCAAAQAALTPPVPANHTHDWPEWSAWIGSDCSLEH